jgi:WD40 repeat protein
MNQFTRIALFLFFTAINNSGFSQDKIEILSVPAGNMFTEINGTGTTILPSGRFATPAGRLIRITDDPFGLAISPDGKKAVTLHDGVFTIIDIKTLSTIRVPSYDNTIKSPLSAGSYLGVAFSKDSKTVYLSGGDNGAIIIYDIERFTRLDSISLNGPVNGIEYDDSFTSDLVVNEQGQFQDGPYQPGNKNHYCICKSWPAAFWLNPEPG